MWLINEERDPALGSKAPNHYMESMDKYFVYRTINITKEYFQ